MMQPTHIRVNHPSSLVHASQTILNTANRKNSGAKFRECVYNYHSSLKSRQKQQQELLRVRSGEGTSVKLEQTSLEIFFGRHPEDTQSLDQSSTPSYDFCSRERHLAIFKKSNLSGLLPDLIVTSMSEKSRLII
jgi:hypothetical protein